MISFSSKIFEEALRIFLILAVSLFIAKFIKFLLRRYVKKFTEKTKTDIDDKILEIITKPLYFSILLAGMYFAIRYEEYFKNYVFYIDNLFFIAYVILVFGVIAKIISLFITKWLHVQKRYRKTPQLFNKIINVFIYLIAILIILDHFNIAITPLIASLGIGGLAIGLALQSTLSDFFAGLHILSDKPIRVGDFIQLEGGIQGFVEDIGWRSTRIKTLGNYLIVVPNNKLAER